MRNIPDDIMNKVYKDMEESGWRPRNGVAYGGFEYDGELYAESIAKAIFEERMRCLSIASGKILDSKSLKTYSQGEEKDFIRGVLFAKDAIKYAIGRGLSPAK